MNAEEIGKELDMAAWEMAEAEGHERMAHKLRMQSVKRHAFISAEIKAAIAKAMQAKAAKEVA